MATQLKEILKESSFFPSYRVFSLWEEVLGADILRQTSPIKYQQGVLTVGVVSAAWANQLRLLAGEIKKKLNRHLRDQKIKKLKFVVDLKLKKELIPRKTPEEKPAAGPIDSRETIAQKLERILSKKDRKKEQSAKNFSEAGRWREKEEKTGRLKRLLRKVPWTSFKEAGQEIAGLDKENFRKIQRRMRISFNDELWRAAREILKNELKDVPKLKNLLYDYVMIKTGKKPTELNPRLIRTHVSAKLWNILKQKVKS